MHLGPDRLQTKAQRLPNPGVVVYDEDPYIEDVVDGDDADEHVLGVDHRQDDEVVTLNQIDGVLAIGRRLDGDEISIEGLGNPLLGLGHHESSEGRRWSADLLLDRRLDPGQHRVSSV